MVTVNDLNTGVCASCLREARATPWNRGYSDCCDEHIVYDRIAHKAEQDRRDSPSLDEDPSRLPFDLIIW